MILTPNNASEYSSNTLDLLVPWDIPLECELDEPIKQQIATSLRSLSQALHNPNRHQALTEIEQITASLPQAKTYPTKTTKTKTALSAAAVEEYDTYFKVRHVQTTEAEDIALCLTQGLLTNCHHFISLCHRLPTLNPAQINQQKQGFLSYTALLERAFNINSPT
ncbi:hypothetical protein [cf. Phormidesmis sp. LEGE 11477]|uniref:hypothetical protein n=1 Tax=cf. Phormidesmis sp. LEGE 11477 TaxID=1828680 RepID=UPI0018824E94|nr:hypothetical protein [cf. Phormidesmis sp. LEGE 11477]